MGGITHNVDVYEPLRVSARTIKGTKLRLKIPKNFPDERCPSNGLYTMCVPSTGIFYFTER